MAKAENKETINSIDDLKTFLAKNFSVSTSGSRNVARLKSVSLRFNMHTFGGFPKGKVTEIMGKEASGKTTFAIGSVGMTLPHAIFVDAESTMTDSFLQSSFWGEGDHKYLLIEEVGTLENAFNTLIRAISTQLFDNGAVIIDSLAALEPEVQEQKNLGGSKQQASFASALGSAIKKIVPLVSARNIAFIALNQLREDPGAMFGSPYYAPGGNTMKFNSSLRVQLMGVRHNEYFKTYDVNGWYISVDIIKNKLGPKAKFYIPYTEGVGIDTHVEVYELATEFGIVDRNKYGDIRLGLSAKSSVQFLKDNEEIFKELLALVQQRCDEEATAAEKEFNTPKKIVKI